MNVDDHLDKMGLKIQKKILQKIDSHVEPGNAPSTIAKKGFDHTLVDKGDLYDAIEYAINDGTLKVGVLENPEIAFYATVNEYGTKDGRIPERSFMRSTWDENEEELLSNFSNDVLNDLEKELDKF